MQAIETRFRAIRERLYASREDIVRRTRTVSLGTVRNVELGKSVRRSTARQLVEAINALLREANEPEVTLKELEIVCSD